MGHRALAPVPLLAALLGLTAASCTEGPPLQSYELTGYVTVLLESGDTGGPIPNARVTFRSDTRIVEETTADGNGRYRMHVDTDHAFGQVRAEMEGFLAQEETVYFDTPRRRVDLELRRTGS